jgi:integrase
MGIRAKSLKPNFSSRGRSLLLRIEPRVVAALSRAGLPPIRLQDLRHTYASVALARGVHPKVVQEAMGHTTISMTLDLYSHVVPTLQRDAAREIGAALVGLI